VIIAVDFDGTCVDHRFPDVGQDLHGVVGVLKALVARGDKLILWTMRSDKEERKYLGEAVQWFKDRGIELWGTQRNPEQDSWTTSPKCYAQLYIDDAALGAPLHQQAWMKRPGINWEEVARILGVDLEDEYSGNAMLFLPGSQALYRCHCGCNVFAKHKTNPLLYRCNGCKSILEGEK